MKPKFPSNKGGARLNAGRPQGTKNKWHASMKTTLLEAFEEVGGKDYLVMLANEEPRVFATLLGKLLPTEVKGEFTGKITLEQLVTASFEAVTAKAVEEADEARVH